MKSHFLALAFLLSIVSCSEKAKRIASQEPDMVEDVAAKLVPVKIEEAERQLAAGAQLLDVRTKEEWNEGHLKNASLVTVTEDGFLDKAKAVLDVKKPMVVYCRSGKRSAMATEQLRAAGFMVYDLEGGITAWIAAGKEVVKPESEAGPTAKAVLSKEQIEKLQSEIDSDRQSIDNIEAFVDMERAKLKENPDYEQSFMLEALEEQRVLREKVEADEKVLKEIARPDK